MVASARRCSAWLSATLGGRYFHLEYGKVQRFGVRIYQVLEILPLLLKVAERDLQALEQGGVLGLILAGQKIGQVIFRLFDIGASQGGPSFPVSLGERVFFRLGKFSELSFGVVQPRLGELYGGGHVRDDSLFRLG